MNIIEDKSEYPYSSIGLITCDTTTNNGFIYNMFNIFKNKINKISTGVIVYKNIVLTSLHSVLDVQFNDFILEEKKNIKNFKKYRDIYFIPQHNYNYKNDDFWEVIDIIHIDNVLDIKNDYCFLIINKKDGKNIGDIYKPLEIKYNLDESKLRSIGFPSFTSNIMTEIIYEYSYTYFDVYVFKKEMNNSDELDKFKGMSGGPMLNSNNEIVSINQGTAFKDDIYFHIGIVFNNDFKDLFELAKLY